MTDAATQLSVKPTVRRLTGDAPGRWLAAGWSDLRRSPLPSLIPGCLSALAGYCIVLVAVLDGRYLVVFPLLAGYLFVAPALAIGLYEISRRHQTGEPVSLPMTAVAFRRNTLNILLMGLILVVLLGSWMWSVSLTFHWFFGADPGGQFLVGGLMGLPTLTFLLVSNAIGAVFAVLAFVLSVVSLPMLLDQDVDVATAVATSWRACVANPRLMTRWAILIALAVALGIFTLFVGLIVILPVLGHASWHAYRDLVECKPRARQVFGRAVRLHL
jgi:uncharacterized membrane protein